jgi:hypothetical protein
LKRVTAFHVAVGALAIGVGASTMLARGRVATRHARRGSSPMSQTAYAVWGGLLVLVGLTQLALAFV